MNIAEIRQKFPQYGDLSDQQLAEGLHKKYYSDMEFADFAGRIGFESNPELTAGRLASQVGRSIAQGVGDVMRGQMATEEARNLPEEQRFIREQGFSAETPMQRQERLMARAKGLEAGIPQQDAQALELAAMQGQRAQNVESLRRGAEAMPEMLPGSSGRVEDAAAGMARFAPAMVTSAINPLMGSAVTYSQLLGGSYDQYTKAGTDPEKAFEVAAVNAAVQLPLEMAGNLLQIGALKNLAKTFKVKGPGIKRVVDFAQALAQGAAGEGLEEFLQQYPDEVARIYAANPDLTPQELAQEVKGRFGEITAQAVDASKTGALGGAMLVGTGGIIQSPFTLRGYKSEKQRLIDEQRDKEEAPANETAQPAASQPVAAVPAEPAPEQPSEIQTVEPKYTPVGVGKEPLSDSEHNMRLAYDKAFEKRLRDGSAEGPPRASERDIQMGLKAGVPFDDMFTRKPDTDIKPDVLAKRRQIRQAEEDIADLTREIDKIANITDKTIAARRKLLEKERRTLEDKIEIDQVEIARLTGQPIERRERSPEEVRRGLRESREAESVLLQAGHLDSGLGRQAPYRLTPVDGNPLAVEAEPAPSPPPAVAGEAKPVYVQRYEAPGKGRAKFDKPQGIYTSPADIDSPHSDLGGDRYLWRKNPDANVLKIVDDGTTDVEIREGTTDAGAGIHALLELVGADEFNRLRGMTKSGIVKEASNRFPEVDFKRFFDKQEVLEAYGGRLAVERGYDAIELTAADGGNLSFDAAMRIRRRPDPSFNEYVGLTERSMTPVEKGGEAKPSEPVTPPPQDNSAGVGVQEGVAKEPWAMTKDEYARGAKVRRDLERNYVITTAPNGAEIITRTLEPGQPKERIIDGAHRVEVAEAIRAGKPVPPEVLKDYPDLAPKPAPEAKAPWEMTRGEFESAYWSERDRKIPLRRTPVEREILDHLFHEGDWRRNKMDWTVDEIQSTLSDLRGRRKVPTKKVQKAIDLLELKAPPPEKMREGMVRKALRDGKSVPADVLRDFPDLSSEPAPEAVASPAPVAQVGNKGQKRSIQEGEGLPEWKSKTNKRETIYGETVDLDVSEVGKDKWVSGHVLPAIEAALDDARVKSGKAVSRATGANIPETGGAQAGKEFVFAKRKPKNYKGLVVYTADESIVTSGKIDLRPPSSDYSRRTIAFENNDGTIDAITLGNRTGFGGIAAMKQLAEKGGADLTHGSKLDLDGIRAVYVLDLDAVYGSHLKIFRNAKAVPAEGARVPDGVAKTEQYSTKQIRETMYRRPTTGGDQYKTTTPDQAAKSNNSTYNGEQERKGKPPLYLFTDNVTGSTFSVSDLSHVSDEVAKVRDKFKAKLQGSLGKLTREDIKAAMPWAASVRQRKTDGVWIVTSKKGRVVRIKEVEQIDIDTAAFKMEYGRYQLPGEAAAGAYKSGEIRLSKVGDKWTLAHESFHWLRDLGVITQSDLRAIDKAIGKDAVNDEDRANWYEAQQKKRGEAGRLARIVQKIADFIDSFVNLYTRTARGVVRDIESGKAVDRKGAAAPKTTVPAYEKTAARWYSQMQKFIEQKLPGSGSPAQLKQTLQAWANKGEFKQDELEWSGVLEWLDGQDGKVSKQEVIGYLEANNLRIEEVEKKQGHGNPTEDDWLESVNAIVKYDEDLEAYKAYYDDGEIDAIFEYEDEAWDALRELASEEHANMDNSFVDDTKFSGFQLPGGQNYRELLITMPTVQPKAANWAYAERQKIEARLDDIRTIEYSGGEPVVKIKPGYADEVKRLEAEWERFERLRSEAARPKNAFISSHWDETNVLAHVRFSEREVDDQKILHIEEIQSDWHQKGRKEGYRPSDGKGYDYWNAEVDRLWKAMSGGKQSPSETERLRSEWKRAVENRNGFREKMHAVPDAPWKKTWPIQAMKRMVRYAAENGFDGIAWTPGDEQAKRYDLSKQVDAVRLSDAGSLDIQRKDTPLRNGRKFWDTLATGVSEQDLADHIGKEAAERLLAKKPEDGYRVLSGIDLEVGGEGMVGFYDKILPAEVNKFFGKKAWGSPKVGTINAAGTGLWHLPITPEMRSKALREGMPLYKSVEQHEQYKVVEKQLNDDALKIAEKVGAFLKRPVMTRKGKQDLSYFGDLIVSIPSFFKDKIPAVRKMFDASQERQDERNEIIHWMENHDDVKAVEQWEALRKDRPSFDKAAKYLVEMDRNRKGYRVLKKTGGGWGVYDHGRKLAASFNTEIEAIEDAIRREAIDLKRSGYTDAQVKAIAAFRMSTNKGFDILIDTMRRLSDQQREAKIPQKDRTRIVVTHADGTKEVSLSAAMAVMGDMRGYYFPRIRKSGNYVLTAVKGDDRILETFDIARFMSVRKAELEKQGYRVETGPSRKLGEDVFDLAGELIKTQQIINAALDRVDSQLKSGNRADIENIFKQTEDIFAAAVAEQVANVIRERGARAHMTKRTDKVYRGYEEDPTIALAKYIRSIAGSEAKRNMVVKMLKAFTGTELSWKDYKAENPDADYDQYRDHVKSQMIDQREQPNAFKWGKAYLSEVTRNQERADEVIGIIKGLAVGKYLAFRVFSAPLVNLTALPTSVVASMKGAGIPYARTWGLLARGIKQYGSWRLGKTAGLAKDVQWALKEIELRGWDNPQFNSDALSVLRGKLGRSWDKVIEYGMFTFSESERLNRVATILAAFQGLKRVNPKLPDGQLIEMAKQVSDDSHGIYNKGNYPFLALGSNPAAQLARSFYVFRTFSHTYLMNMRKLGFERKDYVALAHMLVAPAVIAGAGASVLTPMIAQILKSFGIDDPEEEAYMTIGRNFGPGSESLARFGLAGLGGRGISMKGSLAIGITDLPTNMKDLIGAPGSVLSDVFEGMKSIAVGDTMKGTERILPTGIGNIIRGYREATEGVTKRGNAPVFYGSEQLKATAVEGFMRGLSFNPARMAEAREKQWKEKQREDRFRERRNEIYAKIKRYVLSPNKDRAEWAEILGEVEAYNERVARTGDMALPRITPKSIKMNIKRSFKPSKRERMREKP